VKETHDRDPDAAILIFDDRTSRQVELDLRGNVADVLARFSAPPPDASANDTPRGPGRPKLGVVSREVALLPRHWEWLGRQPGGASVALRKLIDEVRRQHAGRDQRREAQEAVYRFMSAIGGDLPGFEEATRALYASDRQRFDAEIEAWPADVRSHARKLAAPAFAAEPAAEHVTGSLRTR
jgi:hypothetical protein